MNMCAAVRSLPESRLICFYAIFTEQAYDITL